jgi:hypothetical protein
MWGGTFTEPQRPKDSFNKGRDGFAQIVVLRGATSALWSKTESQETVFTLLTSARLVGTPWV